MSLINLSINNLRNLREIKIPLTPKFNLFYGINGSGKTSILEAIYFLGLGRSFRNRLNNRLINYDDDHFSLFSQLNHQNQTLGVGVERHSNGESRIRINQENVRSALEITKLLPLQLLNTDSRQLLTAGSKLRRQFIDWGTFHVEPQFLSLWQQTQRIIKQRNAALKTQSKPALIQLWDHELLTAATQLHLLRQNYIAELIPVITEILSIFFTTPQQLTLRYYPGWNEETGLEQTLKNDFSRDLQHGYTHHGPHRCDLHIRIKGNIPAQDILSHGQQKLLVYSLYLAQGQLLGRQTGKHCVYLLDDLAAELDKTNQQRVGQVLNEINAQVFITAIEPESFEDFAPQEIERTMFHVEHGIIHQL